MTERPVCLTCHSNSSVERGRADGGAEQDGFPSRGEHCPLSRWKTLEAQRRIPKCSLQADAERFAVVHKRHAPAVARLSKKVTSLREYRYLCSSALIMHSKRRFIIRRRFLPSLAYRLERSRHNVWAPCLWNGTLFCSHLSFLYSVRGRGTKGLKLSWVIKPHIFFLLSECVFWQLQQGKLTD